MNNLSNLTQKFANYFPLYYNARYYEFSNAKLLLNSAVDGIDKELRKIQKHLADTYPLSSDGSECAEIYTMDLADNTSLTTCEVSGYLGTSVVTTTVNVEEDIGEFFNHIYFEPPEFFTNTSGTSTTFDQFTMPSGYYHIIYPTGVCDFSKHGTLNFYCLNVFGNVDIVLGTFKLIRIHGLRRGCEHIDTEEVLYVKYDGSYQSKYEWSYIEKIEFLNLKNTVIKIQAGNYNYPMRFLGDMYVREQRTPVPVYVGWEDAHQCFTFCEERVTPAAEKVYDPIRILRLKDDTGTQITNISDFQIEQTSRNLVVLVDNKLHYYSTDIEIPSGVSTLTTVETCPFNILFEMHNYDVVAIKLQTKFISDSLDCTIVMTMPSGGDYIVRSNGQPVPYTGQRESTAMFTERILVTLPSSGLYKFSLVFWDAELYEESRHEMLFDYELKEPLKTFTLGDSYTGISQLTKTIYGLYKNGTLTYYRARHVIGYYDIDNQQLAIYGILPLQVTTSREVITTELEDLLDATPHESPFVFIGDV